MVAMMMLSTNVRRFVKDSGRRVVLLQSHFHTSSLSGKPIGSQMSDNDPSVLKNSKEKLLRHKVKSTIKEAPGWCENLASDSEANVKADNSSHQTVETMQEETIEYIREKH
ncbi:hypothetical protein IWQ62_004957 [Dispira parvispora]|uniref:Uncharacterized protein n=1 Tax=Dispira parvispora TaxID=1520584 RepID=A0A9W8ARC0_9FUNG|nr:hypothetical protein IWQ62_004957 [Dispira parvispora]